MASSPPERGAHPETGVWVCAEREPRAEGRSQISDARDHRASPGHPAGTARPGTRPRSCTRPAHCTPPVQRNRSGLQARLATLPERVGHEPHTGAMQAGGAHRVPHAMHQDVIRVVLTGCSGWWIRSSSLTTPQGLRPEGHVGAHWRYAIWGSGGIHRL